MSRARILGELLMLAVIGLGVPGCKGDRVSHRRPHGRDALAAPDPRAAADLSAPRLGPPTQAERTYDARRQAQLLVVIEQLEKAFGELRALAQQGAAEPAFREAWTVRRSEYLAKVGRVRTLILEVDPLGRSSHGARAATRLLGFLEVQLPNAAEESWSSRPSGALRTWSADFDLICSRLRRYVQELSEPPMKGTHP